MPVRFHVQNVDTSFNEDGVPADKTASEKNANIVVSELLWSIEAIERMKGYKFTSVDTKQIETTLKIKNQKEKP